MASIFNRDFQDFLRSLNNNEVDYILVGGYAVILHGYARTTGDMDIWVQKTAENYHKLVKAFIEFQMPIFDMTLENFLYNEDVDVFSFGNRLRFNSKHALYIIRNHINDWNNYQG